MRASKQILFFALSLSAATALAEENLFETTVEIKEATESSTETLGGNPNEEIPTELHSETQRRAFDINNVKPSGSEDLDSAAQKCRELS
jgi:hypothetical protein